MKNIYYVLFINRDYFSIYMGLDKFMIEKYVIQK